VTFTTYALSLSFFQAVTLDALIRGGGRQALILADADGIRASLSEQGAARRKRLRSGACFRLIGRISSEDFRLLG
jgi:hypothetical protein